METPPPFVLLQGGVEAANAMEAVPLRIFRESETIHRWRLLNCHEFCHEKPSEYNFSSWVILQKKISKNML